MEGQDKDSFKLYLKEPSFIWRKEGGVICSPAMARVERRRLSLKPDVMICDFGYSTNDTLECCT